MKEQIKIKIIEMFSSNLTTRDIEKEIRVTRKTICKVWKENFLEEEIKLRTNKMNSFARLGKNNPMYGKKGVLSPVYEQKFSEEERKRRSKAMKGSSNPQFGKSGINLGKKTSQQIKDKIRQTICRQYAEGKFKGQNTKPELKFKEILKELNIKYSFQYSPFDEIEYWFFGPLDFAIPSEKIAIEIQGDYWHSNPEFYIELSDKQKLYKEKDEQKKKILEKEDWRLLAVWEYDILNRKEEVKNIVIDFFKGIEVVVEQKLGSKIIDKIINDEQLLNKIKQEVKEIKNFRKVGEKLGINRHIINHLNIIYNWIKFDKKPIQLYMCSLCDFKGRLSKIVKHYFINHNEIVNQIKQKYLDTNKSDVIVAFLNVDESIILGILDYFQIRRSHEEAMKVRKKPISKK